MNAPRARLAAAFCLSLAVARAAFSFAPDAHRLLILVLAFAVVWHAGRKNSSVRFLIIPLFLPFARVFHLS